MSGFRRSRQAGSESVTVPAGPPIMSTPVTVTKLHNGSGSPCLNGIINRKGGALSGLQLSLSIIHSAIKHQTGCRDGCYQVAKPIIVNIRQCEVCVSAVAYRVGVHNFITWDGDCWFHCLIDVDAGEDNERIPLHRGGYQVAQSVDADSMKLVNNSSVRGNAFENAGNGGNCGGESYVGQRNYVVQ